MKILKTILSLTCLILFFGCYKEDIITADDIIISMTGNNTSIAADGTSKQLITIEIPSTATDANNSITLTTTKGLFEIVNKNTVTVTAQNIIDNGTLHKIASVNLISSNDTGTAYVTATIKNYSKTAAVSFTNAYAEQIKLSVDKLNYQISKEGEVTVTVKIDRLPGNGSPTPGQTIVLTALDNNLNPVGSFRNFNTLTDTSGICTNYFSIPLTNPYTGTVTFKATVQSNSSGTTIPASQTITAY
ncbi:hypothetical protein [Flavobacterium sp. LC2016-01]|uniref:hypothetical protein n=1 Tax=Flavobacterium sp. LC2016-01 TaxID=2675876 RepID=UPI0012BA6334|nr:hypothetical protein [Flavobacterium sp. LC2016-01]MTH15818.1 hypothetical protein [Flavobacterium sp. LC2016-01]